MAPRAVADSKKSVQGDSDVTGTLNNLKKQKSWKNVVDPQLARREEQEKQRIAAEEARKAEEARVIASQPVAVSTPSPSLGGSKEAWMTAAGIPQAYWGYVDYIVSHESGWNPYARNASSGAGGLPQALPYGKTGCAWGDAVCQLVWMNSYVNRYGGWAGAYSFWVSHHWY